MNKKKIIVIFLFIAALVFAFIYRDYFLNKDFLVNFFKSLGLWAPVLFCFLYIIAALAFIPASFVTLIAGAIFGLKLGLLYAAIGTVIAASFSFWVARYIARDWITKKSGKVLNTIEEGIKKDGWKYLAIMRLVPVFPFSILNYAFGLTPIKLSTFAITILFASFPINLIYAYAGFLGSTIEIPFLNFGN